MNAARSIAAVALAVSLSWAHGALARDARAPADRPDRREVLHIVIAGDLDTTRLALDLADAVNNRAPSTDAIVLELAGDRWRRDVLWMIAQSLRESGLDTEVFLGNSKDRSVGLGMLALGLTADRCVIAPATTLTRTPSDDRSALAPETTEWERVDRELNGLLWVAMRARHLPGELGEALLTPTTPVWVVRSSAGLPAEIAFEPPPAGRADRMIDTRPDGSASASIAADLARELGLVDAIAKSVRSDLVRSGPAPSHIERITLTSGLDEARARAADLLEQTDAIAQHADARLTRLEHPIDRRVVSIATRATQAQLALDEVAAARDRLDRVEALFDQLPELLALDAPAGTRVGRTPAANRSDWRYAMTSRAGTLRRLADRARDHLARAGQSPP